MYLTMMDLYMTFVHVILIPLIELVFNLNALFLLGDVLVILNIHDV